MQGFTRAMNTMMTLGGITAALSAVGIAVNKALDFGEAGAKLINLERSFENLAARGGQSAQALLADITEASNGIMSQADAMAQYNQAVILLGQDMGSRFGEMVQMAMATSASGLGSFQQQLDSLVRGVARAQPEILDNLGIVADWGGVYEREAAKIGKAANELTKFEKQSIMLNESQRQLTEKLGDLGAAASKMAGTGIARLRVATKDYIDYLKVEATPSIDRTANAIADMFVLPLVPGTEQYQQKQIEALTAAMNFGADITTPLGPFQELWEVITKGSVDSHQKVLELARGMDLAAVSTDNWRTVTAQASMQSAQLAKDLNEVRQAQLHARNEQQAMINTAARLSEATNGLAGATDAEADSHDAAALAAGRHAHALEVLAGGLKAAQSAAWSRWRQNEGFATQKALGIDPLTGEPYYAYQAPWEARDTDKFLEDQRRALASTEKYSAGTGRALGSAGNSWDEYASRVRSAVDSILQPTQSVDLGSMFEQMGLREDAWDEKARRAMDVFNLGTDSPWAESLGLSDKAGAAQWIKDFYMGRMPEQIDWSAFDTALAEANEKTANWERIKEMAYQRASGMGLDSAGVAGALGSMGMGGYLGQGAALAGDLTAGFDSVSEPQWLSSGERDASGYYGAFRDTFTEGDWTRLGDAAGSAIKDAILDAAAEAGSDFLDELAAEISPYVARYLTDQGEYTPEV